VCDVRSTPFSRFNPQFNREALQTSLQAAGIAYVFLGKELGARSDDPACYHNGKVQYDRLAATALFQEGLDRIRRSTEQYRIVLMCAEKEPLDCHRTILVSRQLVARGFEVHHILADGCLESHDAALTRLAGLVGVPATDLVHSREEILQEVYRRQAEKIAYTVRAR
jgi:uncharacterized protein (DUF488 family)